MGPDLAKAPVRAGEIVGGKYRIESMLGVGGMGIVMAARHLALDEPVALKFITDDRARDGDARGRMMREARATFRLRSTHTVRVFDIGELPSGPLYIVMELLEGRDLKAELAARGRLPEVEVARYAVQACDALEEAHAMGIVHRDLKPHNMFLAKNGRGGTVLKILDFGMSKVDRELFEEGPMTKPATALGTPRYMAPEQWKSAAEVDARADVWALGVVMYELLTGAPPVAELRGAERMARLVAGAIESPRERCPDVSEPTSRAVMRCLRADPSVRWPSVRHLATALIDVYPDLDGRAERAEISSTGVTLAVSPADMKRRAAAAFAGRAASKSQVPTPRPTLPETPAALSSSPPPSSVDEFDLPTEVRAPQMTPAHMVAYDLPPPAVERELQLKPGNKTLRSAIDREVIDRLVKVPVAVEPTLKMAPEPARELLARAEAESARLRALASDDPGLEGPPSFPLDLQRARPVSLPVPRRARGPRVTILVLAGGLLSIFALLALGWLIASVVTR